MHHDIDMPSRSALVRHAARTVLIVSALPMAIFYAAYSLAGLYAAILATLSWYYGGMLLRVAQGKPVLLAMGVGAGLLTLRGVTALLTGSAVIYFLQPVAGTIATATAIAVTALAGRPMLDRLAHEFCPFPAELGERLRGRRFFSHLSVVWSFTYVINAIGTVWLLTSASIGGFIVLKTLLSPLLTGTALMTSYLLFRLAVRREGVRIHWGRQVAAA